MFRSFKHRATELELMDGPNIPHQDLYKNYKELHWVNRYLGGYKASFFGIKKALNIAPVHRVVDVGSGGGNTIALILGHFRFKECLGIDYSKAAIKYSQKHHPQVKFIQAEYKKSTFPKENTLIHTALFNHHLNPKENEHFLAWAKEHCQTLVINDLQRNFWAWLGIYLIKLWPGFSYLFKNDAPLSVRRAHSINEWKNMLNRTGYTNVSIYKKPMFRYVIVAHF